MLKIGTQTVVARCFKKLTLAHAQKNENPWFSAKDLPVLFRRAFPQYPFPERNRENSNNDSFLAACRKMAVNLFEEDLAETKKQGNSILFRLNTRAQAMSEEEFVLRVGRDQRRRRELRQQAKRGFFKGVYA